MRSFSSSEPQVTTRKWRFARSKERTTCSGSRMPSWARMSSRTRGVAVAVSASRRGRPSDSATSRSPRYAGRKSWPHCETQWASSTANSETCAPAMALRNEADTALSGVTSASFVLPSASRASAAVRSFPLSDESMRSTATPSERSFSVWSRMSARSGDTTSVVPGSTCEVSWYVSDLPLPVGMTASTSRPARMERITCSCPRRNAGILNADRIRATASTIIRSTSSVGAGPVVEIGSTRNGLYPRRGLRGSSKRGALAPSVARASPGRYRAGRGSSARERASIYRPPAPVRAPGGLPRVSERPPRTDRSDLDGGRRLPRRSAAERRPLRPERSTVHEDPGATPLPARATLADVRASIDLLDRRIVELLAARRDHALHAARLKAPGAAKDPARERQVLAHVASLARRSGLEPDLVEGLWRDLMAALVRAELAAAGAPPPEAERPNVAALDALPSPEELKQRVPLSPAAAASVQVGRRAIEAILEGTDPRLLVVVGPCSIHDTEAGLDYARRLRALADEVSDTLLLVMRVYLEKPRTSVGWEGFTSDPRLDGSCRVAEGMERGRRLLADVNELGLPVGTEALDPMSAPYHGDLVSWYAIGARTTESQTHRNLASGLSTPTGFKNGTDGGVEAAVNAIVAAAQPHAFLGIDERGRSAAI